MIVLLLNLIYGKLYTDKSNYSLKNIFTLPGLETKSLNTCS